MGIPYSIYKKKKFYFPELKIYQENISVNGEHYSGKTKFAIECILKPLLKTKKVKLWMWDVHGLGAQSGYFEDNQIVYYLDELSEGTQCYVPEDKSKKNFDEFCGLCVDQYNLHVVLDELHNYMSAQTMTPNLSKLIRDVASNRGVTYTGIWQRVSEGHKAAMSNARHKFLFKYDISDQDRYLRIFGKEADLFMKPEDRKYFADCKICKKPYKECSKSNQHLYEPYYPILDHYSFLYKDDKLMKSEVFNGGF